MFASGRWWLYGMVLYFIPGEIQRQICWNTREQGRGERRIKGEWGVQKEREVVGERVKRTPHLHSIQKD